MLLFLFSFFPIGNHQAIQQTDDLHQKCYQLLDTNPDSASVLVDRSLKIALEADYVWGAANSYYIKGYIFHKLKNKSVTALLMYMRGGKLLEKNDDLKSAKTLADIYINAGSILRIHGKMDEAIALYDKAINGLSTHNEKQRELLILFNKAYALHDKENFDEATNVLSECIKLAKTLNNSVQLNNSWNLLGDTMLKAGKDAEAQKCFRRVIQNEQGNEDAKANSANNLADYFLSRSNLDSAKFYYQLAIHFGKELSLPILPFYSYKGISRCYLQDGDFENGILAGKQALILYDSIIPEDEHFMIFDTMSDLYALKGDHDNSHYFAKKYVEETNQYFNDQKELIEIKNEFQIDLLLASFYNEIEIELKDEEYLRIVAFSATILLGIILIISIKIRSKISTRNRKIIDIIHDVK